MKKTTLPLLLFFLSLIQISYGQDISTHIPATATYVIMIDPAAHIRNGDFSSVRDLQMFSRTGEWGNDYRVGRMYGDETLDTLTQKAFEKFVGDAFKSDGNTGVDTTRKLFIFDHSTDSVSGWGYLFPLKNSKDFGAYVKKNLFGDSIPVNNGSGYSKIIANRMCVGWTDSYALIFLANYYYMPSGYYNDYYSKLQLIRDSIAAAASYADAVQQVNWDTVINDSIRAARMDTLNKEIVAMRAKLAKDTITDEEDYQYYYSYDPASDDYEIKRKAYNDSCIDSYVTLELGRLINMTYESSIESIANFRSVNAENADAVYWYNYGDLMQQRYTESMRVRKQYYYYQGYDLDTSVIVNMWKGSYMASIINFNDNNAYMQQRMYFTPALQAHTHHMYWGKCSNKMFKFVNGENLMGFLALSVNMEKFMKFYGSVYRETLTNSFAGIYESYYLMCWDLLHVFLDESTMYNMLDGKFLFAVTDLKPYTNQYVSYEYDENFNMTEVTRERTQIMPEFVFIAEVGKEKKANEILTILNGVNAVKKQNAEYYIINMPAEYNLKLYLALTDGMLIITDNEDLMVNHLKNGYKGKSAIKNSVKHIGRKSALVGYWDGQKSVQIITKNESQNLSDDDKRALDLLAKEINSGTMIGRKSKKGVQRIDLKMTYSNNNSQENGFVRFFQLLNSLYLIRPAYYSGRGY